VCRGIRWLCEREKERETESKCVCVRECKCVCECASVRSREGCLERDIACVCILRVCVCV